MYLELECKVPFAYIDMGRLCVKESSLHFINDSSDVVIPAGRINTLFLGPGSTITHSAIKYCSWSRCTVMWVGEDISKCYSVSSCQSRSSDNFLKQIYLYEHKKSTLLKRYCVKRFGKVPMGDLSEEKIRGIEGAKMKKIYFECALKYGIPYSGRKTFGEWSKQAAYDRAISMGNSFLYGICCAALNALGYSTALGILHSGNLLSLVFDVADLYKIEFTIPMGFEIAKDYKNWKITDKEFDRVVRRRVLEKFQKDKLLNKILSDVEEIYADDMYNKKHKESDENCPDEFPLRNTA